MTRFAYEKNGVIYTFGEDDEPPPLPIGTFESGLISVTPCNDELITDEDALEDEAHAINALHDDDFYPLGKIRG